MKNVLNFVAFQTVWFAAVLGAAQQLSWAGPLAFLIFTLVHFGFNNTCRYQDFILLLIAIGVGTLIDSGYQWVGLLTYQGAVAIPYVAPLWIIALWGNFALTLNHSLGWLRGRTILAVVFGAVGGPLSYLVGERLGALEILEPAWLAFVVIGAAWAVMTPLLTKLMRPAPQQSPRNQGSIS